jgi:hypothetical protein
MYIGTKKRKKTGEWEEGVEREKGKNKG